MQKMNPSASVLVTGAAGFIGFHLCKKLLEDGLDVVGIDNLNEYYDVTLKQNRLKLLEAYPTFRFFRTDLKDKKELDEIFEKNTFEVVVNLAAQAGVRYSLTNPYAYLESNLTGFLNVLGHCDKAAHDVVAVNKIAHWS